MVLSGLLYSAAYHFSKALYMTMSLGYTVFDLPIILGINPPNPTLNIRASVPVEAVCLQETKGDPTNSRCATPPPLGPPNTRKD